MYPTCRLNMAGSTCSTVCFIWVWAEFTIRGNVEGAYIANILYIYIRVVWSALA
jgi:hypothetical protein